MKLKKFRKLTKKAVKIQDNQELTWEEKYDLIFSEKISGKAQIDWYDPDTTYEEDVRAFVDALKRRLARMEVLDKLDCDFTIRVVERCEG